MSGAAARQRPPRRKRRVGEDADVEALRARVAELERELKAARSALDGVSGIVAGYRRFYGPLPGDHLLPGPSGGGWRPGGHTPHISPQAEREG